MPIALPTGTVTFLFSDVEGSTRLLERLGHEAYADALSAHREAIAAACADHGGVVVDTEGDGCFLAFPTAPGALEAALVIQATLAGGPVRVRIGLHTGTALVRVSRYVGMDVHRAARIAAAAHGGQIVFSASTRSLLGSENVAGSAVVRDLGEHRLKDLPSAERLFQLGDEQFPPLRTLHVSNLPAAATSFLGRRQELSEVVELLCHSDVRLVSLVGPGGAGKTRLALEAAAKAEREFADGVWWTPLAPLHDPARVLTVVAQTLGVGEGQDGSLLDRLAERLAGEHALLVLDNAEHLLPRVAVELTSLVASCPSVRLLVTSRERLQVSIETVWPVPPLAAAEAEQLFVERAGLAGQELTASTAVSQLCDRLDGLPLAIELAAARTVVFTPEQLLARLGQRLDLLKGGRDADPRQRTLRAAIDWSYDLLTREERRVFGGLSVFTGGCTLEAAEEVVGADPDTLQSLIDKSLVRRRATELGPRYSMLATIAEYAAEKLETEVDADTVRRRFADWCRRRALELLGIPGPEVPRLATTAEVARFTDDYNNVRSALAWTREASADELGVELGTASCRFWLGAGLYHDAASWLRDADPSFPPASPAIRLQALKVAGLIAFFVLADSDRADVYWAAARDLAQELELEAEAAWIEHRLAGVAWERGDLEGAKRLHERLLAHHRRDGNRLAEASTLHNLGETLRDLGDFDEAEQRLLEAEAVYRELGSPELAGNTHSLADLALDRGDHATAMTLYRQALLSADGRERRFPAYCLAGIASVLAESGRDDDAALAWGSVCATEQSHGFRMVAWERRRYERRLARFEGTHAWSSGRALSIDAAVDALGLR